MKLCGGKCAVSHARAQLYQYENWDIRLSITSLLNLLGFSFVLQQFLSYSKSNSYSYLNSVGSVSELESKEALQTTRMYRAL